MKPKPLNTEKLHIALGQALRDLTALERDSRYRIDMEHYHKPIMNTDAYSPKQDYCAVCLAGACMVRRLGAKPNQYIVPIAFGKHINRMLLAIDYVRMGMVHDAIDLIHPGYIKNTLFPRLEYVPSYHENPKAFKKKMTKIQQALKIADL